MAKIIYFLLTCVFTFNSSASSKAQQTLEGVSLLSEKVGSNRSFSGKSEKIIPLPLSLVKAATLNFSNRCNNNLKDKRRFTPKSSLCGHHNENLIESFIDKVLGPKLPNYSESYLLARQIYNRGHFGYYELVTVEEGLTDKKQRKIVISLKMLSDQEVREIASPKFSQESAFRKSIANFVLTELNPESTSLSYTYSAETDHWLLNKEVSVPQVFSSISKSINDLFKAIEEEASLKKKELEVKEE